MHEEIERKVCGNVMFKKLISQEKFQKVIKYSTASLCTDDLYNCFSNLEPIIAGDFVLETVGDLEAQPAFTGANCLLSGLWRDLEQLKRQSKIEKTTLK